MTSVYIDGSRTVKTVYKNKTSQSHNDRRNCYSCVYILINLGISDKLAGTKKRFLTGFQTQNKVIQGDYQDIEKEPCTKLCCKK